MSQHDVEAENPSGSRRLMLLSIAAYGMLAIAVGGCAQDSSQEWQRPEWFRSKRGSNGNGGSR